MHFPIRPGVATTSSGYRGAPNWSTRNSRIGMPCCCSSTPSAFQNAVAASTFPAARSATALNPIVTRCTAEGSTPPERSTVSSTASSEGTPVTPIVLPARSAGARISFGSPRDHRGERPLHYRCDRDEIEAALSGDAEVVDVHHREIGAAGLEQLGAVRGAGRLLDGEVDPCVLEVAVRLRGVDAGVHRIRLEVEDKGRAFRRARFSAAPSAARDCGPDEESGRQQRGDPSHSRLTLYARALRTREATRFIRRR